MGNAVPKQYLQLGDKPVIQHAIEALFASPLVRGITVALADDDRWWEQLEWSVDRPLVRAAGGAERRDSVLNALRKLRDRVSPDDWVLVHDAARPCLRQEDLDRLLSRLKDDPTGGLLAVPVRDTMKSSNDEGRVASTVDRECLWHALTPQMFRHGPLMEALEASANAGVIVTDEASAIEYMGHSPQLVQGHADNIKITRQEDLALAEFFLRQQGRL